MASPTDYGPRMLRCPACNAGLPVDGVATIVTCSYCSARVEIDRRGRAQKPASVGHAATPQRSYAWMSWLTVPFVLMFSGGLAAYQWYRAQSLVTAPTAVPVAATTPAAAPKIATIRETPSTIVEAEVPSTPTEVEAAADAPVTPSAKPHKPATTPPAPTGPVISVDEARKLIEPKARACMKTASVHHMLAYMGNSNAGPVKVLPDPRTHTDGKKVALGKTALGRCLDDAGAKVRTSAFKSNYVRLDVRNDDVPDPLGALPAAADTKAVREVIAALDDEVKACARKHGKEGSRESFRFTISGPTGKPTTITATFVEGPFRSCALAIYKGARFPKVQSASYQVTYPLTL